MIDIWFEAHAQTYHNAAGLASGHYDVALTEQGRRTRRPSCGRAMLASTSMWYLRLIPNVPMTLPASSSRTARSPSCGTHGCASATTGHLRGVHAWRWNRHAWQPSPPLFPRARVMRRWQYGCGVSWGNSLPSAMGNRSCSWGTLPLCGCLSTGCRPGRWQRSWVYSLSDRGDSRSQTFPVHKSKRPHLLRCYYRHAEVAIGVPRQRAFSHLNQSTGDSYT